MLETLVIVMTAFLFRTIASLSFANKLYSRQLKKLYDLKVNKNHINFKYFLNKNYVYFENF